MPRRRERLLLRRRRRAAPFHLVAPDLPVGGVRALVRGVAVNVPARTFFRRLVADVAEAGGALLLVLRGAVMSQLSTRRRDKNVRLAGAARACGSCALPVGFGMKTTSSSESLIFLCLFGSACGAERPAARRPIRRGAATLPSSLLRVKRCETAAGGARPKLPRRRSAAHCWPGRSVCPRTRRALRERARDMRFLQLCGAVEVAQVKSYTSAFSDIP